MSDFLISNVVSSSPIIFHTGETTVLAMQNITVLNSQNQGIKSGSVDILTVLSPGLKSASDFRKKTDFFFRFPKNFGKRIELSEIR